MTVIPAQYVAFDGEVFEDEDDCLTHEKEARFADAKRLGLKMYSFCGEPTDDYEEAGYVKFSSEEAYLIFCDLLDEEGMVVPQMDYTPDLRIYYDENRDEWKNFNELLDWCMRIENMFCS